MRARYACLAARGAAVLEGVGQAEADEGEHDGDGGHDRHDHPQLEEEDKIGVENYIEEREI